MQGARVPDVIREEICRAMSENPRRTSVAELARVLKLARLTVYRIFWESRDVATVEPPQFE